MSDFQHPLEGKDLDEIAETAHAFELQRTLEALDTSNGDNFGGYKRTTRSPRKGIKILPSPAVGPKGSKKICEGTLTIGGDKIDVTAFRLA